MLDPVVERLEEIRKYLRINKSEFARRIDSPQSFVSKIFSGERNPGPGTIDKVVKNLNISRGWLETGEGSMFERSNGKSIDVTGDEMIRMLAGDQKTLVEVLIDNVSRLQADKRFLEDKVEKLLEQIKALQEQNSRLQNIVVRVASTTIPPDKPNF